MRANISPAFHAGYAGDRLTEGIGNEQVTVRWLYGMPYNMAIMTHRTTFALDEPTVSRIRTLAAQWNVSQAEVIRRVVAQTAAAPTPDPIALLDDLFRAGGGVSEEAAAAYLADTREARREWRRQ